MFYIHHITCISAQKTFTGIDIEKSITPENNQLLVTEPPYEDIPPGILRRMGKAVRIGVGAALPVVKYKPDGIIIGTANGGMEDCIKFLNQIIEYNEGMLTPTNFVQSTANAIAGQIGLMTANKGYNCTHVHRGLAFENAAIDASLLLKENPSHKYLVGGVDEISAYNYNIEFLGGWYKKEEISGRNLYQSDSAGTIAGEGSVMFLASHVKNGANAQLLAIRQLHSAEEHLIASELKKFIHEHLPAEERIDLLLSGENGDNRLQKYYLACEDVVGKETSVARLKHIFGTMQVYQHQQCGLPAIF